MMTYARQRISRDSLSAILVASVLVLKASAWAAESGPSFEREVLPILSEHCFHCHGPDEGQRKAGLRLDTFDAATAAAKSGQLAIVPGKAGQSELWNRINSEDADEIMPPNEHGKPLTAAQKAVLKAWIEEGAKYTLHWAFRPLKKVDVPVVDSSTLARNAIDAFVLSRLDEEGVTASPSANRHELIKRLYYDLLGLLPSPSEVREFVDDDQPAAYERLVERLLKSEHFGERW